jgi:hypothetical protein
MCIALACFAGFGHVTPVQKANYVNLWYIVLFGSLITLVFGFIGFSGGTNVNSRTRSVLTSIITLGLSIFSIAIIVMGNIFQFT